MLFTMYPYDKTHEVWKLKVTNDSDKPHVSVFGYCEFTNDNNYEQDRQSAVYTLYHKNIFHGKPH